MKFYRNVFVFILALLLGLGSFPEMGMAQTESGGALFVAGRYDKVDGIEDGKFAFSVGVAKRVTGPIWAFPSFDLSGDQNSLNVEFGPVFDLTEHSWFAIIAGPNVDWQDIAEWSTADQVAAYLSGGTGVLLGHNWSEKIGISGMGKYNFKLDEASQTLFKSGWSASLALHYFLE